MSNKERQQQILNETLRFTRDIIRPAAGKADRDQRLHRDIIKELAKRKLILASLPESVGGLGLDPIYYGFVTEEIGKACCSTRGLITLQSSLIGESILRWGTAKQKSIWLPSMAKGEKIGAFGLTEPDIGSNAEGVKTAYRKTTRHFVINGHKKWISFGEIADFFLIFASFHSEVTAFIIERERPGIEIHPQKGLLGNRAAHHAEIEFKDVNIPEENVLGREGSGFTFIASTALDHGRYSIAWAGVAIAQEALDCMAAYALKRQLFGRKISEFQLIQRMIANAVCNTQAARALCIKAGEMRADGSSDALAQTAIAKYFSSKVALKVAADAVQVHGGNGCSGDYPAERLFREAKVLQIIEGTSQIHQQIIAKYGLKKYGNRSLCFL